MSLNASAAATAGGRAEENARAPKVARLLLRLASRKEAPPLVLLSSAPLVCVLSCVVFERVSAVWRHASLRAPPLGKLRARARGHDRQTAEPTTHNAPHRLLLLLRVH